MIKILGHRGINQPENKSLPYQNTLEAFEYAISKGADGFELDVIASKDGKCFVIHDDDISKHNAGQGLITNLTTQEIKTKKIADKYNIPNLSEVLEIYKNKQKTINIEIKQKGIPELVAKEILASKFPLENIIISSFEHQNLADLRALNKDIKIGLLFGKESREDKEFEKKIMFFSQQLAPTVFCMEKTLSYLSVLESKNEKYFWTIKKEDMSGYIVQGLNMYNNVNFITDYPEELISKIRK